MAGAIQKVKFEAHKKVKQPTKVSFKTNDGEGFASPLKRRLRSQ
jgi:hypothetical protein